MPHSIPVSQVIISPRDWVLLRAHTPIREAIGILRILSEEEKLERGRTTPLVLDDRSRLLGLVRLTDLLRSVRHLCDEPDKACKLDQAVQPLSALVKPFPGSVGPRDGILKALDIMLEHGVSLVPVLEDDRLMGIVQLGDIFNTVAALLFDEDGPNGRSRISKYLHL
ncbi:HPP family protein [Thermodesulfobacteriota bacterium]